jgi:hypothetical protein
MFSRSRRNLLLLCFVLAAAALAAQGPAAGGPVPKVSLITILPGSSLYSAFGHTMFRVNDESGGTDHIYNYGVSVRNFDEKFVADMLRGKMLFMVSFQSTEMSFGYYRYRENRSIIEQDLNLDKTQVASLLKMLDGDTWAENREYNYNYFSENCTTKPWKLIMPFIAAEGGSGGLPAGDSIRAELVKAMGKRAWFGLILNILLGPTADCSGPGLVPVFLPGQLMELIDRSTSVTPGVGKIAQPKRVIYKGRDTSTISPPIQPVAVLFPLFALSLVLGLIKARRVGNIFDLIIFSVSTLTGISILIFWLQAGYPQTGYNLNLLWTNPIALLAYIFAAKGFKPGIAKWMFFTAAFLAGTVAVFGGFGIQVISWEIRIIAAIIAVRSLFQARGVRPGVRPRV